MLKPLRLEIITPEKKLLGADSVLWVKAELVDGSIGIHPGHAPLIAETVTSPLIYADKEGEHQIDLQAGILEIHEGVVSVLTRIQSGEDAEKDEGPDQFDRLASELFARLTSKDDYGRQRKEG